MTSQLNVDTIVDKAGSGGTNIKVGNDATFVSEGGSANSNNLVQGLLKMFVRGNSSAAFTVSFNTSSGTDLGTGNYDYAFTNNMSANEYPVTTSAQTSSPFIASYSNVRTTAIEIDIHNDSGTNTNSGQTVKVHGDLA